MKNRVIAVKWLRGVPTVLDIESLIIGIIAIKTQSDKWQAYLGVIRESWEEDYKTEKITSTGVKLAPMEAITIFPQLDINTYDYFTNPPKPT